MEILLWAVIVVLIGVYITGPIVDPDLWWHITAGRWIIANGQVPTQDHWTLFGHGHPWVAYSWLNEVLFAAFGFGEKGLLVLKLLVAVAISFSLCFSLGKASRDWFFGGLIGAYATIASYGHFTLRPQSIVWIIFVWLLFVCDEISRKGLSKGRGFWLVFLMSLWANSHLSAIFGIIAVLCWLWPQQKNDARKRKEWLISVVLSFLGTLITPYLGAEWLILFSKSSHPFLYNSVIEFGPATILQYWTVFLLLLVTVGLVFLIKAPSLIKWPSIVLFLIFFIGGLSVVKFMPFAVIAGAFVLAQIWREAKPESLGELAIGIQKIKALYCWIPREGFAFVGICLTIVMIHKLWIDPVDLFTVPKFAVDFIQEKSLPKPLINTFGQGGYLMYRFSDKKGELKDLVSIDGRTNVTPLEVWKKESAALNGQVSWQEYFDLVKPETVLWRSDSPLVAILEATGKWCTVFRNGSKTLGQVVLVKKEYFEARRNEFSSENCK